MSRALGAFELARVGLIEAFIATVNTAPGHFDRKQYQGVGVPRPVEFLNLVEIGRLVKKLIRG